MDDTLLRELLEAPSPSGFEGGGQAVWLRAVGELADTVETDAYGTAWAEVAGTAGGDGPRVMIEAHADEIGFMVRHVTDGGFLHVTKIGGSDETIARGRVVRLLGDAGEVAGVIGNTAVHLRDRKDEKMPEVHSLFVDVGASDRREVLDMGIRPGTPMVYETDRVELANGRLAGRALDNRVGGYVLVECLRRLREGGAVAPTVLAVNAVQEEIGLKGAGMIAYRLRPDCALVLDVTHATDTPGIEQARHGRVTLGGGPTLTHGTANHPGVVRRLQAVAGREGIAVQHEASSRATGTDTDAVYIAAGGIPSALVSLPLRYMHSPVETADPRDIEAVVSLVVAFLRDIGAGERFGRAG